MLTISTWLWGDKYNESDVRKLRDGISRHLREPYRFVVVTEQARPWFPLVGMERWDIEDPDLIAHPGCFARLRAFDSGWQQKHKVEDRFVWVDLDSVVVGNLEPLFNRPEPFVILAGANSHNPCPFNGSIVMLRAGYHGDVWSDFSFAAANALKYFGKFPQDQDWLAHKLPAAATWRAGPESGVYSFLKPGWPKGRFDLPEGARLVVFPGAARPSYLNMDWVKENWV